MIIALSCISHQGLWILTDPQGSSILDVAEWTDTDSTGLSAGMARQFDLLIEKNSIQRSSIKTLFAVTGPGAFTGIRMSSAFAQGLARGLSQEAGREIPLKSIPTFDLIGRPFFIPLRHQKAKDLTLEDCLKEGLEFLKITNPSEFEVAVPVIGDSVMGIKNASTWPTPEQLLAGIRTNLSREPGLKLLYGLEPKISGKRA